MGDRIDKLPIGSAYQVAPTKDAKEDDRRERRGQDESSFRRISDWERYFLMARQEQKAIQIPTGSIAQIRFRNAAIHKGSVIFHVDLVLTDGSFQTGCLLQHPRIDLYAKVQGKRPGDLLPKEWFAGFDPLIVTLFSADPSAIVGADPQQQAGPKTGARPFPWPDLFHQLGLLDPASGRIRLGVTLLYGGMGCVILAAVWLLIRFLLVKV